MFETELLEAVKESEAFAAMIAEECERGDYLIASDVLPLTSQPVSTASLSTLSRQFLQLD